MCKLGDIIVVNKYIGDDKKEINKHSFVVIGDKSGTITGLDYDFVAMVISSFKNNKHRLKKLEYEENMELSIDAMKQKDFRKSSYIKADQAYYFNKKKLDYYILGRLKKEYIEQLIKLILKLDKENKLKQIVTNL